jgi:hypothetical protein
MSAARVSLFGFRLAPAASSTAPAAASALSAKVGGPEPAGLRAEGDAPLAFRSAPLVPESEAPSA